LRERSDEAITYEKSVWSGGNTGKIFRDESSTLGDLIEEALISRGVGAI
jgi:hypothetical protein